MAPIYTYRGSSQVLLVDLLIIWSLIACKLITVFVIIFHASYSNMHVFFFEIPPFEEVQDPDSSPRREVVSPSEYLQSVPPSYYGSRCPLLTANCYSLLLTCSPTTTALPFWLKFLVVSRGAHAP